MIVRPALYFLLLASPAVGSCPDFWTKVGQSCFKVSPEPMNWYQARQYCAQEDGHLIEIRDQHTQGKLASFLNTGVFYWIGLTDMGDEGTFRSISDSEEPSYTNWKQGEPNDWEDEEDCVHLRENFEWNDRSCHATEQIDTTRVRKCLLHKDIHALCQKENKSIFNFIF